MSHHGQDPIDPRFLKGMEKPDQAEHTVKMRKLDQALSRDAFEKQMGPTDHYPAGLLSPADEGEVQFGVANTAGKVILNFGASVSWVGMDPNDAIELAQTLIKHARAANRTIVPGKKSKPLVVEI